MTLIRDRQLAAGLVLVIVVTLLAHTLPGPRTIDDAFITFRYSRNIVTGMGFVYNPGVHTLGTTTPLYTLLMAAISVVTAGQDFPWYALTVNALAAAGTASLLLLLLRRVTGNVWFGLLIGLLWGIAPSSVTFAVGGMETAVNILWTVAAAYCFVTDRRLWLGVFVGLAFLTRIDSLIWIGPLMLYQFLESLRNRRIPWRTWIAASLTVLPWLLFALVYFGSPVPNSLSAKSVAYIVPQLGAFSTLLRDYVVPFKEWQLIGSGGVPIAALIYLLLALLAMPFVWRQERRLLPMLVYPWLYLVAFSVVNPLIFRWYGAPPMPWLMLAIMIGLWAITRRLPGKRVQPIVLAFAGLFWISSSLAAWELHPAHGPDRPAPEMAWHQIEIYYEQIGRMLRDDYGVTAETRVASADIGAIGYFSGATIIDTVGLVTPELAAYYPLDPALVTEEQNYAIPPQMIYDTDPAYLVTMEAFVRLGLETDAQFQATYELAFEIPTDFYGTGMRLYAHTG